MTSEAHQAAQGPNFKNVGVSMVDDQPRLQITFEDDKVLHVPLTEQVALVLNAGGWMMREYSALVFARERGVNNEISQRLRALPVGGVPTAGMHGAFPPANAD